MVRRVPTSRNLFMNPLATATAVLPVSDCRRSSGVMFPMMLM